MTVGIVTLYLVVMILIVSHIIHAFFTRPSFNIGSGWLRVTIKTYADCKRQLLRFVVGDRYSSKYIYIMKGVIRFVGGHAYPQLHIERKIGDVAYDLALSTIPSSSSNLPCFDVALVSSKLLLCALVWCYWVGWSAYQYWGACCYFGHFYEEIEV